MTAILFTCTLTAIGSQKIIVLPESASRALPSRGMVLIEGTINGAPFQTPLEPDGRKGHFFKVSNEILKTYNAKAGDTLAVEFEPLKKWPDPRLPKDFDEALLKDAVANDTWSTITPKARWDWVRWINGTKNPKTRKRRIEVACSKLRAGNRRPCCFNSSECTDQDVSKNGVLLAPTA